MLIDIKLKEFGSNDMWFDIEQDWIHFDIERFILFSIKKNTKTFWFVRSAPI